MNKSYLVQGLESISHLVKDQWDLDWISMISQVVSIVHLELVMNKAKVVFRLHELFKLDQVGEIFDLSSISD